MYIPAQGTVNYYPPEVCTSYIQYFTILYYDFWITFLPALFCMKKNVVCFRWIYKQILILKYCSFISCPVFSNDVSSA
jgi:hypothetical protein